jgi:murein DD-endopeptidase MepM/ murein hydrolase activator NlpD
MAISSPLKPKVLSVTTTPAKTVKKFQTILLNRTKVKKEIFQRKTILQNRRVENERRKQLEDELEAPNLVTRPRGPSQLIAGSAKGFFDRLIGFLGYLTAGWIINNLPTWIAMGKEFIARTQQMGKILGGFITNSTDIFKNFTKLLGATLTNLMKFDFLDTSGRVKTAFDELNLSVENWGTGFEDAIKLLTTPLTEGIASGEDAPPTGTENTNEGAYERTAPYSGSGGLPGAESPEMYRIAAALSTEGSGAQSTVDMMQVVVNRKASGKYGSSYTEILSRPSQFEGVEKKGIAGFKKIQTLQDASKWSGQSEATLLGIIKNIQDPSLQNSAAKYVGGAFEFRAAPQYYLKNGLVPGEMGPDGRFYGSGWRGGRGDNQFLKDPVRDKSRINPGGPASFSNLPKPIQQSSPPQQSTPGTGQSFRPLPQGSFKGGERQKYLASRDGGRRKHLGIDITESNWKPGSDPRIPVVAIRGGVVSSRDYVGGTKYDSGMVIDQDDGYSVRYLHMTPSVRPGQKVSAGQRIGRLVDLEDQTHLHIELYAGSKRLDPTSYITTIEKGGVPAAIARQQSLTPTPARITPTGTPQNPQIPQSLAQERIGPTVIVSQNPSSPARQMMYSGGGGSSGGGSSQISDFALLNNFIKNKLLLDLAYL